MRCPQILAPSEVLMRRLLCFQESDPKFWQHERARLGAPDSERCSRDRQTVVQAKSVNEICKSANYRRFRTMQILARNQNGSKHFL